MKKLKLSLLFLYISAPLWAQVPNNIQEKFKKDYSYGASWTVENGCYKAKCIDMMNIEHVLVYTKDGELYRHQNELAPNRVPLLIQKYYKEKYPNEKNYSVWIEQDEEGKKTYYIPRKKETIYFDKDGSYLRKEKIFLSQPKAKNQPKNKLGTTAKK